MILLLVSLGIIILLLIIIIKKMSNCEDCKKIQLNNCDDCDFTVNTDCVDYTDDRLSVEDSTVTNGSVRDLTSIIKLLDQQIGCINRASKEVTDDYTVIEEDGCKILLLNADPGSGSAEVEKTIILPDSEDFYNKVLILKDVSEYAAPSGNVVWAFDTSIKYNWKDDESSDQFNELADTQHKTLWLAFLKHGVNYQWTVISNANLQEPEEIRITTFLNGWEETAGDAYPVKIYKLGKWCKMVGFIKNGDNTAQAFIIPDGFRPRDGLFYPTITNTFIAGEGTAYLRMNTNGTCLPFLAGYGAETVDSGRGIYLDGISYFTD